MPHRSKPSEAAFVLIAIEVSIDRKRAPAGPTNRTRPTTDRHILPYCVNAGSKEQDPAYESLVRDSVGRVLLCRPAVETHPKPTGQNWYLIPSCMMRGAPADTI